MNIPILTRLLSLPWGFTSPFRAEEYFYVDAALKAVTFERALLRDPDWRGYA